MSYKESKGKWALKWENVNENIDQPEDDKKFIMCLKVCKTFKSPTSIIDPGVKVSQPFTFLPIFRDFKEVLSTKIRYVLHYLIIIDTFERSNVGIYLL